MKPRVAVIVSSYNRPRCLREALASVSTAVAEAADTASVHVVVADDWSDDPDVQPVLYEYGYEVARPFVHSFSPKRGECGRISLGINAALDLSAVRASQYVCFLPDDDLLTPCSIASRVASLEETGERCVYGRLEACHSLTGRPARHDERECEHRLDTFYSETPVKEIANRLDHSMPMMRMPVPYWPDRPTFEFDKGRRQFLSPDAGFFFSLELHGFGPFRSINEVVAIKRYHDCGWKSVARRE